jgi:hypothetical protein
MFLPTPFFLAPVASVTSTALPGLTTPFPSIMSILFFFHQKLHTLYSFHRQRRGLRFYHSGKISFSVRNGNTIIRSMFSYIQTPEHFFNNALVGIQPPVQTNSTQFSALHNGSL